MTEVTIGVTVVISLLTVSEKSPMMTMVVVKSFRRGLVKVARSRNVGASDDVTSEVTLITEPWNFLPAVTSQVKTVVKVATVMIVIVVGVESVRNLAVMFPRVGMTLFASEPVSVLSMGTRLTRLLSDMVVRLVKVVVVIPLFASSRERLMFRTPLVRSLRNLYIPLIVLLACARPFRVLQAMFRNLLKVMASGPSVVWYEPSMFCTEPNIGTVELPSGAT